MVRVKIEQFLFADGHESLLGARRVIIRPKGDY